jgi:hypothetical protein
LFLEPRLKFVIAVEFEKFGSKEYESVRVSGEAFRLGDALFAELDIDAVKTD